MSIKNIVQEDHIQVNKYTLTVPGMIPLVITAISGIEQEIDTTDLPDRTTRSSGRKKQIEFEITMPMHHTLERIEMQNWLEANLDPVQPNAQRTGTLTFISQSRNILVSYVLQQLYPFKMTLPDLDLDNDGEMGVIVWGMKCSEIDPLN